MARAPRSFVDPVEVAQFNLEALTHKDDEADAIIKGPIKVEIKKSEVNGKGHLFIYCTKQGTTRLQVLERLLMDDVFVKDISVLEVQEEGRKLELKNLPGGEEKRILVFENEESCSSIAKIIRGN